MSKTCQSLSLAVLLLATHSVRSQGADSLQQAVEQVQRDTNGKILSAETVRQGRAALYRIKVLTPEGRVQVITVPAMQRADPRSAESPPDPEDDR